MKRFRFPLRPVAVLRAHRELRAREAFAASVHAYVQSEEELATVRQRIAQFENALFAGRRERFSAAAEAHQLAAYRRERGAEAEQERAVIVAREAMQKRRVEYLEAHRKLQVVERLEAKARAEHHVATLRAEQAEFDDFAGRQAHRRALSRL
ncbi:MAG TPA: flagellar FliJ family protein [Opitutaceae bacterium]|nr:flagellar FliJ family protein [Opitutaceae bacterium]